MAAKVLLTTPHFFLPKRNTSRFSESVSELTHNSVSAADQENKAIDETALNLLNSICRKSGESFEDVKTVHFYIFLYKTFPYFFKICFA